MKSVKLSSCAVNKIGALCCGVRSFISCKGIVENRIPKYVNDKSDQQIREEREAEIKLKKHPNPRNRKEELSYLTEHCSYEYVPEFQRWANDLMAITDDPKGYREEIAYNYHKQNKLHTSNETWEQFGLGLNPPRKLKPHEDLFKHMKK